MAAPQQGPIKEDRDANVSPELREEKPKIAAMPSAAPLSLC